MMLGVWFRIADYPSGTKEEKEAFMKSGKINNGKKWRSLVL